MENAKKKIKQEHIAYSSGEEMTNRVTHIVGAVLSLVGGIFALVRVVTYGYSPIAIFSVVVYAVSMVIMFTISSLYHSMRYGSTARAVFRRLDHCSISVLIFGTYAPLILIGMTRGTTTDAIWGYCLFGVVAVMAILSIVFNAINVTRFKVFCLVAYVIMGWACVIRMDLIVKLVGWNCVGFLLGGGVAYTLGIIFFVCKKIPYNHAIWHVFVLAGAALHFVCIYTYLLVPIL